MSLPDSFLPKGSKKLLEDLGLRQFDDDGEFALFEDPQNDASVVMVSTIFESKAETLLRDLAAIGIEQDVVVYTYQTTP